MHEKLIEMVKERLKVVKDCDPVDPLEATCWFISYQQAMAVFDSYSTKDLARMIQDGDAPAGPFKTVEHVEGWLDEIVENYEGGEDEMWQSLGRDLDRHFGIEEPGVTGGS